MNDIANVYEIAALLAVAMNHHGFTRHDPLRKDGDDARVGRVRVLSGAVDIEEPQRRRSHTMQPHRHGGVKLAAQLIGAVGVQWARRRVLGEGSLGGRDDR